jgi:hypothetical protein
MTTINSNINSKISHQLPELKSLLDEVSQLNNLNIDPHQRKSFFSNSPLVSWLKKNISNITENLLKIINHSCSYKEVIKSLKAVATNLNRIYNRLINTLPAIANQVLELFEGVCSLLPFGTALQLELIGDDDYTSTNTEPVLAFAVVKQWLSRIGKPIFSSKHREPSKFKQLELNPGKESEPFDLRKEMMAYFL